MSMRNIYSILYCTDASTNSVDLTNKVRLYSVLVKYTFGEKKHRFLLLEVVSKIELYPVRSNRQKNRWENAHDSLLIKERISQEGRNYHGEAPKSKQLQIKIIAIKCLKFFAHQCFTVAVRNRLTMTSGYINHRCKIYRLKSS